MERGSDPHQALHSVASIVEATVVETDVQIASLNQSLRQLVSPAVYEQLTATEPQRPAGDICSEAELVYALEKQRLDLVMDIQEQCFAGKKLREMVGECEELVHAVTEYYRNSAAPDGPAQPLKKASTDAAAQVADVLAANTKEARSSFAAIQANAARALRDMQDAEKTMCSAEYQAAVAASIAALNRLFAKYSQAAP